ncbi:hypothetical protein SLEP1_g26499 [Rubroshorea leprosula]|uniref:Reverse transcriptase domain-containing protein n=1 Tax=Rubroshorea leprosula TaxID=152421 RepID=A0AAV5JWJ4_9ROSI|nr:hypothetical protein SLEP1_g26499 [Rubroshorea leprosula]
MLAACVPHLAARARVVYLQLVLQRGLVLQHFTTRALAGSSQLMLQQGLCSLCSSRDFVARSLAFHCSCTSGKFAANAPTGTLQLILEQGFCSSCLSKNFAAHAPTRILQLVGTLILTPFIPLFTWMWKCHFKPATFTKMRDKEERRGRYTDVVDMRGFNDFILDASLEEIPMVGRKFTWYKSDGTAMSKLDRFLFSTEFLINFPNLIQRGFDAFVRDKWSSFEIDGWGCYKLKEKLKMLKKELKAWNKEVFGVIDRNMDAAREEIKQLDEKEENEGLTSMEIDKRKENFHKFMEWSKAKDNILFQKSRQRWLKEGDANTKFFHGCIVNRRKQNEIIGLYNNGEWIEDADEVKELARNYFKDKFEEEKWDRPSLGDLQFKKISEAENNFLISKFSTEEIDEAVWGCNGAKSLGPDGFNFNFIKKVWPVIKEDVYAFLAEFHENGKLVKGSNTSFIVLIRKKENPQSFGDYRPISLIGSMYKIISKILANRLRRVMDSVISPNQTTFIGERQIIDGIVITNEIIHEAKQSKKPTLVFKADFEKAYDSPH